MALSFELIFKYFKMDFVFEVIFFFDNWTNLELPVLPEVGNKINKSFFKLYVLNLVFKITLSKILKTGFCIISKEDFLIFDTI